VRVTVELLARTSVLAWLVLLIVGSVLWPLVRSWRRHRVLALSLLKPTSIADAVYSTALLAIMGVLGLTALVFVGIGDVPLSTVPVTWARWIPGTALILLASCVTTVAQAQMGRSWRIGIDTMATPLVTHGLYRWIRSPIYTSILIGVLGTAIVIGSAIPFGCLLALWLLFMWEARREEAHLMRLHPEAFAAWTATTGRFLPPWGVKR